MSIIICLCGQVLLFHGASKTTDLSELADHDIVVTTHSMLTNSMLSRIDWHRLVLDEAHRIKDLRTGQARAAAGLVSRRRWVVTPTPVGSSIRDFEGLLPIDMHIDMRINMCIDMCIDIDIGMCIDMCIDVCIDMLKGPLHFLDLQLPLPKWRNSAIDSEVLLALRYITIRHTKDMVDGSGRKIIDLPELHEQDVGVELTAVERRGYDRLHHAARRACHALNSARPLKAQVMALLEPLHRFCGGGGVGEQSRERRDKVSAGLSTRRVCALVYTHVDAYVYAQGRRPRCSHCLVSFDRCGEIQNPKRLFSRFTRTA